jgi:hypothetical protein
MHVDMLSLPISRCMPPSKRQRRVIKIVASDQEEAEARKLLEAEGFDPNSGDIGIIRLIAIPAGQPIHSEPPRRY